LSYKWYSTSNGTAISDATTYTPSTATVGVKYYYVIVTNTIGEKKASVTSNTATVTVNSPTGILAPDREVNVFSSKGILTVNTPSAERIDIYSFNGMYLYSSFKPEGKVTYLIGGFHEKTLIVRGSSGWVRKIVNESF
jgi:hypothetical protein